MHRRKTLKGSKPSLLGRINRFFFTFAVLCHYMTSWLTILVLLHQLETSFVA